MWHRLQKSGDFVQLVRPSTMIFWSFATQFLLCDFCEEVSVRLESITDGIYMADWYTFPIEIQKMALMIMTATEQTVVIGGFGNVLLTRDTFKKVTYLKKPCIEISNFVSKLLINFAPNYRCVTVDTRILCSSVDSTNNDEGKLCRNKMA